MAMNPAMIMKMMQAKNQFTSNHPKFSTFLGMIFRNGVTEGTIIEISVQKPGEEKITSNIRVQQSDLDLLQTIKEMGSSM